MLPVASPSDNCLSATVFAGANVSGFLLPRDSYEEVDVNAAMGTFSILDSAAENVAGVLHGLHSCCA